MSSLKLNVFVKAKAQHLPYTHRTGCINDVRIWNASSNSKILFKKSKFDDVYY
jgi:hypothetical protein